MQALQSVDFVESEHLIRGVPVAILWSALFPRSAKVKVMLVIHGYIDESGDGDLFTLSCLHGDIATWTFLEIDWLAMLEGVNKKLKEQGRQEISRYHAADCASCQGEFAGWTLDEQKDLTRSMINIFKQHKLHIISYSISLKRLQKMIPETKRNPRGFAYVLLLQYLMLEVGDFTLKKYPDSIIGLTHDRCDHNAALQEAFQQMLKDDGFPYRDRFTTLAPMSWKHCIPLQPADLFAYENFKEGDRRRRFPNRKRRYTLRALLSLQKSIGGRARNFGKKGLTAFKKMVDGMDAKTKRILFATGGISIDSKPKRRKTTAAKKK